MMKMLSVVFLHCSMILGMGCGVHDVVDNSAPFEQVPESFKIVSGVIDEASGIAESKLNPGYLWTEQDSGAPPELALIDTKGNFVKKVFIKNAENRDWEDLTIGPGPEKDKPYIYIADIGDNGHRHALSYFYRLTEPAVSTDTVLNSEKISFVYTDGPRDAEAFLVDHNSLDIYIITKKENRSRIYKLAYPQSTQHIDTAFLVGELPFKGAVSAAVSDDGKEIIIKTYKKLYYWTKPKDENIASALTRHPINIGYKKERQGEAICFATDGSCFFTLSEKPLFASEVSLQCYRRK